MNKLVVPVVKKGVILTGASSGIGAGLAVHLAELGYKNLSLVARRRSKLEQIAAKCRAAGADNVIALSKDLTVEEACEDAIAETVDHFGRLDILISNAGGGDGRRFMVRDLPTKSFNKTLALNITAPFVLTKHAIPHLEKTRGNILYVSSATSSVTFEGGNAYCASKAGLNQLARCVALEEAPNGIRANILSPGCIVTPIHTWKAEDDKSFDMVREITKNLQPLGRSGEVEEVYRLAAFLVSDDNSFMTGSDVVTDGGLHIQGGHFPLGLWEKKEG